jgi:hypothetical protein
MSPTAVNSGGTRACGVWSYTWWWRRRLALLYSFVRFRSTPGWTIGGRGVVWHWWDYVAVNIRLRKEQEEALCREGNGDNGNSYRGRGTNSQKHKYSHLAVCRSQKRYNFF